MNIDTIPVYAFMALMMLCVAVFCGMGIVAIDLWVAHRERQGKDASGAKSLRRLLLILAGVCAAIAFFHMATGR